MSSAPYFKLYFSDLAGDTLHLSDAEIGSYVLLLGAMWNGGGRLPLDPEKLSRIARVTRKAWARRWSALAPYFIRDGRFITHKRLSAEREKANIVSGVRKEAGERGAKAKALKTKETGLANASENGKQKSSIPKPYTKAKSSEAKASSLSAGARARRERASEKVSIPDGYPDAEALCTATAKILAAGADLPAALLAERFRNHALSEARTSADWSAAWANWVSKEIGKVQKPASPGAVTTAAFPGPDRVAQTITDEWPEAGGYLKFCGWRDIPPTILAPVDGYADKLRARAPHALSALQIEVAVERTAA